MPSILFRCKYFVKNLKPIMPSIMFEDVFPVKKPEPIVHSILLGGKYRAKIFTRLNIF